MAALSDILDQLTSAIVVLDGSLQVTYLNQTAQALCGKSAARSTGAMINDLFVDAPDDGDSPLQMMLAEAIDSGQPFTKRETAVFAPATGERMVVNLAVSPLADGELLLELAPLDRIIRINREDTNRTLQDTTRHFIRGLAHEVKNPLGGIRGAAQLLSSEISTEQQEYTDVIIAEADRLRNLVDRMLGPNGAPVLRAINIHQIIERVVQIVSAESYARVCSKPVDFVRKYDPSVPEIDADAEQLVQAMLNVVRNAFQALAQSETPKIILATGVVRNFTIGQTVHRLVAEVQVIDNGPGIAPGLRDRIFYPMISGRSDGSGLGLAITQAIIGQHNGVIDCESEPGNTRFSIYLPIKQAT